MSNWALVRYLQWFLRFSFWPLVLVLGAGFSLRQGVVMGLSLWAVLYYSAEDRDKCRFMPYWVRITPNWYTILSDLKLVEGREDWLDLLARAKASSGYSVLTDGVHFTVVQQEGGKVRFKETENRIGWREWENFERALIFWNQRQVFGSEFRFAELMAPLRFEQVDNPLRGELLWGRSATNFTFVGELRYEFTENRRGPKFRRKIFVGIGLGVEAPADWWERAKGRCEPIERVDVHPETASVRLSLATLPVSEFGFYRDIGSAARTTEYIVETGPSLRTCKAEARGRLGWNVDDEGRGVTCLSHKYFTVSHGLV